MPLHLLLQPLVLLWTTKLLAELSLPWQLQPSKRAYMVWILHAPLSARMMRVMLVELAVRVAAGGGSVVEVDVVAARLRRPINTQKLQGLAVLARR